MKLYAKGLKAIALGSFLLVSLSVSGGDTNKRLSGSARPWTFWYWMYGAVSKQGIKADLSGMKQIGVGGCYLMPIRGVTDKPEFGGKTQQLSPTFWNMVDYAFQQADSLDLDMGIHICDGFALAGAPQITPAESMQKVVWTDTIVNTAQMGGVELALPESYKGYYEDIACYALPLKGNLGNYYGHREPLKPVRETVEGDMTKDANGTYRATNAGALTYDFGRLVAVNAMEIVPSGNNIQYQRVVVKASNDGINFFKLVNTTPQRQGWQSSGYGISIALPETVTRYIKVEWTVDGSEPGSEELDAAKWKPVFKMKKVVFSTQPTIDYWRGKAAFVWAVGAATNENTLKREQCISTSELYKLVLHNGHIVEAHNAQGKTVTLKQLGKVAKQWRVLRMGHTSTGQMNATAGGGKGLEIDKFSTSATQKLFNSWFKLFLERPHVHVVKVLHVDSWECGSQNWGRDFEQVFQQLHGYNLLDYLPVMAGWPVESAQQSEKVLKNVRETIDYLVNTRFFGTLKQLAHDRGLLVSHESIAPTFTANSLTHYQYADIPMGEFWLNSPTHDKPNDMFDAISGAHIYGKNIIQAEGFTEVRGVWNETPAMLKPLLDRYFALGMNKLVFHVNAHNPWIDRKPGMTLDGIGLFFQRDNVWYKHAGSFVDYISRCQTLLQQGEPVVDVAVFGGEETPSRALTPEKLVKILPGLVGEKRLISERNRLENAQQPMTESPVGVHHSANIFSLDSWDNALNGYHYDTFNREILLKAEANGSTVAIPNRKLGYKVLVLAGAHALNPNGQILSAQVQAQIDALRKAGVAVIDKPWQASSLTTLGISPDAVLPEGIAFTHRQTAEGTDIYFICNTTNNARTFNASLRVAPSKPCVLYDAVNNVYRKPTLNASNTHRTELQLELDAYESIFVIFNKLDKPVHYMPAITSLKRLKTIDGSWSTTFSETGIERTVTLPDDWTQSLDERIKYFSGTAIYTKSFTWKGAIPTRVSLSVGRVHAMAHVFVNGIDCGTAWTPPYAVDIQHALKSGRNELCIEVANTWANALKGNDEGHPPYPGIWTNAPYRLKMASLLPSGLMGPVVLNY